MMLPLILTCFPQTAICLVELLVLFVIRPRYPLICSQLVVVSISTAFAFEKVMHVYSRTSQIRAIETSCWSTIETCGTLLGFELLYVTPACHLRFSNPYITNYVTFGPIMQLKIRHILSSLQLHQRQAFFPISKCNSRQSQVFLPIGSS